MPPAIINLPCGHDQREKKTAQKQNTVTSKEQKKATDGKYKGRDVVSYDGGKSWEYK